MFIADNLKATREAEGQKMNYLLSSPNDVYTSPVDGNRRIEHRTLAALCVSIDSFQAKLFTNNINETTHCVAILYKRVYYTHTL